MKIPILSFFTGGGFLDLGFEQAGFDIKWTNEANSVFADLFEFGMTSWRSAEPDKKPPAKISNRKGIEDLTSSSVLRDAFGGHLPPVFGVIGGPPCPDFSAGGLHRGELGQHGRLSKIFIDLIADIQPAFFLFENVPGLYRKAHSEFLYELRSHVESAGSGYYTQARLLNALDYGVPQDRERLFVLGVSRPFVRGVIGNELLESGGWFTWPSPVYVDPKKMAWPTTSTFGSTPGKPSNLPDCLTVNSVLATDPPPSELANGRESFKPHSWKFWEVPEGATGTKSFKRLHRYRYSPTAWYGNNEVHLHPWEPRRLTVREAMRLQSIPDSYELPTGGPLAPKFKLICNGVPCTLARHVAQSIHAFIEQIIERDLNSA